MMQAPPVQKRAKLAEETPEITPALFKNIFDEEFAGDEAGLSQDIDYMFDHCRQLLNHFDSPSAVAYLKSGEARNPKSKARTLIESARDWITQLKSVDCARILFAAIMLGGTTLK